MTEKWKVVFEPLAKKEFKKLDRSVQRSIIEYFETRILTTHHPQDFGKPLSGNMRNLWRYRIGDYRLICHIQENTFTILVLRAAHRSEVYAEAI